MSCEEFYTEQLSASDATLLDELGSRNAMSISELLWTHDRKAALHLLHALQAVQADELNKEVTW